MTSFTEKKKRLMIIGACVFGLIVSPASAFTGRALAAESEAERQARLVEGAKKEGKLLWYLSLSIGEGTRIFNSFREKYPFIDTQMYRSGDETILTKIISEARVKRHLFDVVQAGGINGEVLSRGGYFAKHLSPQAQFYPPGHKDPEGYWVTHNLVNNVIAYHTRLVAPKDVPKTYGDLLNPRWRGRMGMDTKAFYWFGMMIKTMGREKGLEYMKRLGHQDIKFRTGRTLNTQLLAAGEFSIGIALYTQRIEELKAQGAPIDWVGLEPVIPGFNHLAISANAPHPNAARLFFDFALSREGQEIVASFKRIPGRNDVDPFYPREKGLQTAPFDASIADDYDQYMKLYREILMKK